MPLDEIILPFGSLLTRIEYETEVTHNIVSLIHCSINPIFLITAFRYDHFTMPSGDSKATKMLLEISQLFVKALWCSVIIFGRIFLIYLPELWRKYKTLQRLIDLYSDAYS